jgi:hypothetical protein
MNRLTLEQEVSLLRSAVIGLIAEKDPEGQYRPEFVKQVFEDLKRKPTKRFVSAEQFLKDVRNA